MTEKEQSAKDEGRIRECVKAGKPREEEVSRRFKEILCQVLLERPWMGTSR